MADNEKIPPQPPVPPKSDSDFLGHPSHPDTDSHDSILDFDAVASVREGASGVIPLDQLPDPQSSPSLVSWTEVIRQHRETQPPGDADAEPVQIDSVSDKDLLKRIVAEELERNLVPAEHDTDELGKVPLVTDEEPAAADSAVQLESHDPSFGSEPVSGSAVRFDLTEIPDDAGGAMPMPWSDDEIHEALPIDEADQDDIPVAEAVPLEEEGEPIELEFASDDSAGGSVAKFIQQQSEAEITDFDSDSGEPVAEHSSILDILVQDGGSGRSRAPSDVVNVAGKPGSGVSAESVNEPMFELGPDALVNEAESPSSDITFPDEPVTAGSGWLTHDSDVAKQTMPSFVIPEPSPEESVDLYAEGPVSHGISDSGSLQISEEQLAEAARKQQNFDSSAVDLSSHTSSSFDLDLPEAAAAALDDAPKANARRPKKQDDSGIYQGISASLEDQPETAESWHDEKQDGADFYPDEAPQPIIEDTEVGEAAEADEEPQPYARPAKSVDKPAGKKKRGGMLIGTTMGIVLGAGGLFAASYFELLPADLMNSTPASKPVHVVAPNNATPKAVAENATPQLARQLLETGNAAKAIDVFKKCNQEDPAVLAGLGQATWLAYLQTCAKEDKQPNPDDAEVKSAQADLQNAIAKAKGNEKAEIDAAYAYVWQGMIEEALQNFDAAEKVYAEGAQELPAKKAIFEANSNRLQVVRPSQGMKVGAIPPAHLLLAFTLLALDEPAETPKADDPEKQECGFLFWKTMLLAAKHDFGNAAKNIPQIKKIYAQQQLQMAGKNLNPLSDPGGQLIPTTLDELQRYWTLCGELYKHEEARMLIDQKKVLEALAVVLAKPATNNDDAMKAIAAKLMLKPDQKIADVLDNLLKAEDARKAAEEMLAAVGKSFKDAGIDDPKIEDGLKKLLAAKADAEAKVKSIADTLDKAGIKDPDPAKALATILAGREETDALVKGLRERFEKAKYIEANATKDQVLKAVDVAITRGSSDAADKLTQEKKEVEAKLAKLEGEADKAKKEADAKLAKLEGEADKAKKDADAKLAKLEGDIDKAKKDADALVKKAMQDAAEQKAMYEAKLAEAGGAIRTAPQIIPDADSQNKISLALKHYGMGLDSYRDGKFEAAEREFGQSIQYDGTDARYSYYRGLSRWQQGKASLAVEDFKAGAALETQGKPTGKTINSSLESIQGPPRLEIEKYRP